MYSFHCVLLKVCFADLLASVFLAGYGLMAQLACNKIISFWIGIYFIFGGLKYEGGYDY